MKLSYAILFIVATVVPGDAQARQPNAPSSPAISAVAQVLTPAQQRIAAARQQIASDPKKAEAYNNLALAFIRRARETAAPDYDRQAAQAIAKGLALAPQDFQLRKTQVALLLDQHEFARAREEAKDLKLQNPDDAAIHGYLARAEINFGDYHDAEVEAQWMLNLLPYNVPGLLIAADLREFYGDPEGALDLLHRAYTETSLGETEELASIANRIASIEIDLGKFDSASQILRRADQLFPRYPDTLENHARVNLGQHHPAEAVGNLMQAEEIAPSAHLLCELAYAQQLAGLAPTAQATYARFVKSAELEIDQPANANRDLIFYYADRPATVTQALRLAQREIAVHHDVWTLDAYAWALYTNGDYAAADAQMQKALAVGVRSAQLFDHAANIALKRNQQQEAARYFASSLEVNPDSEYAPVARKTLATLATLPASTPTVEKPVATGVTPVALKVAADPISQNSVASELQYQPSPQTVSHAKVSDVIFAPVPASLLIPQPTGTERILRTIQSRVQRNPKDPAAYSALGAAFFQRARETGDVEDFQLAEQSLNKSLDLLNVDFSADAALSTMAEVCMGEHRFNDAITYAEKALALGSGDLSSFAIVGDANADMGEYERAAVAYSRLDVSGEPASEPRSVYVRDSRTSYLKFISGDTAGAIHLMQSAVTAGTEARLPAENLAWLYFELGEYEFLAGDAAAADAAYLTAVDIHPGDYRALAGLGKLRGNQGHYAEAIKLYQSAIAVVPMPIYVAELGDLYTRAGNVAEARKQYQLVEYIGLLSHMNQVLHNRDLALFYADHDIKLDESLALARKEFEVRHDIYTWDALAWALYKNGRYPEASDAIANALRPGTRDPLLFFHAGMIASRLGQTAQATDKLQAALSINPQFHFLYADAAREQLKILQRQAGLTASQGQTHVP